MGRGRKLCGGGGFSETLALLLSDLGVRLGSSGFDRCLGIPDTCMTSRAVWDWTDCCWFGFCLFVSVSRSLVEALLILLLLFLLLLKVMAGWLLRCKLKRALGAGRYIYITDWIWSFVVVVVF